MRSAIIHDWLVSPVGGSEKCLQSIHELYPSPIYTLVHDPRPLEGSYFEKTSVINSWIQRLPFAKRGFRNYLPWFPMAIESFDLSSYDLVLSSSHCVAKGVLSHTDQLHICYCHTPMRYIWDLAHQYFREDTVYAAIKKWLAQRPLYQLRSWDVQSSHRVDYFIANSHYVARRIKKIYRREAHVIYPPVDLSFFTLQPQKDPYYLTASRMVPYKRLDLVVEAFASMPDKRLVVIGTGPEERKIRERATPNVEFLGSQTDRELRLHLQKAKGFVFAALEDFGILPVEAMACGTPVIGFEAGGLRETVQDSVSGIFFKEQSAYSIREAIQRFESLEFDPATIRSSVERFSKERFQVEFRQFVDTHYRAFTNRQ